MKETIKAVCGNDWENILLGKSGSAITTEENRLKSLISQAKVQPDIAAIENELNKKPAVAASELKNSDYRAEMLNLVSNNPQRANRKSEIIAEINQLRNNKLESIRSIITNAQNILNKGGATKEELETAINDLKIMANANADSPEKVVWEEKKTENQKLLTDLETKLSQLTPPKETPPNENPQPKEQPEEEPVELLTIEEVVPEPAPDQPLTPQQKAVYGKDYQELKPQQQEKRKKAIEGWNNKENKENKRESICSKCQKSFEWDNSLAFLPARNKALAELKVHKKTCSSQSKPEQVKKVLQEKWTEEANKSNVQSAYSCQYCWGKVYRDKTITNVEDAETQHIADLVYHEKHECGSEGQKKIAIYFSPNEGGNEHAPRSYAEGVDKDNLMLERIYFGETSQEQVEPVDNKGTDLTPWIVGSAILVAGVIIVAWLTKKKKVRKD